MGSVASFVWSGSRAAFIAGIESQLHNSTWCGVVVDENGHHRNGNDGKLVVCFWRGHSGKLRGNSVRGWAVPFIMKTSWLLFRVLGPNHENARHPRGIMVHQRREIHGKGGKT